MTAGYFHLKRRKIHFFLTENAARLEHHLKIPRYMKLILIHDIKQLSDFFRLYATIFPSKLNIERYGGTFPGC